MKKGNPEREYKRLRRIFSFLCRFASPFFKKKYNYSYESLKDIPEPFLLYANHNMDLDPALVGMAVGHQIYYVAADSVLRKPLAARILKYVFNPIIHEKGKLGVNSTFSMLKLLRAGKCVCLFPEGNRSFNGETCEISPVAGKFAKKSGVPLVTFRISGGYLTQPRWSTTTRKGKVTGKLVNIYSVEKLKSMTEDEINQAIKNDLHENAYESNSEGVAFKGKKLALGLESTLFYCPECNSFSTIKSDNTSVRCEKCGVIHSFNEQGYLVAQDNRRRSIFDWDKLQQQALMKMIEGSGEKDILFSDSVSIGTVEENGQVLSHQPARLEVSQLGFIIDSELYTWDKLTGIACFSRNTLSLHIEDKIHLEIKGEMSFNALKYLYIYNMIKGE